MTGKIDIIVNHDTHSDSVHGTHAFRSSNKKSGAILDKGIYSFTTDKDNYRGLHCTHCQGVFDILPSYKNSPSDIHIIHEIAKSKMLSIKQYESKPDGIIAYMNYFKAIYGKDALPSQTRKVTI